MINSLEKETLTIDQKNIVEKLKKWDKKYEVGSEMATFFSLWWQNISYYTWDELDNYNFYIRPPDDFILSHLINDDSNSEFFDKMCTSKKERFEDIANFSFADAFNEYKKLYKVKKHTWGFNNRIQQKHLTNIQSFDEEELGSSGHPNAVNAVSKTACPTWKMIVQLGKKTEGYGIYPGGQSGEMSSNYYNNFTKDWLEGKYYKLNYYSSQIEASINNNSLWIIK
jgi:penicillin amidase